jgi:hypothetical protein
MIRVTTALLLITAPIATAASPLDDPVYFTLDRAVECSSVLLFTQNAEPKNGPLNEPLMEAMFTYGIGGASLARKAKKGPRYMDDIVEARQADVAKMTPVAHKAVYDGCMAELAKHKARGKKRK